MARVIGMNEKMAKQMTHKPCGAIIEYFENEVTYKFYKDYGGGSDKYGELTCPHCGKLIQWAV